MQGIRIKGNLEKIGGDEEKSVPPFISFGMGGCVFMGNATVLGALADFMAAIMLITGELSRKASNQNHAKSSFWYSNWFFSNFALRYSTC